MADDQKIQKIDAPFFYASSFQIMSSGNDFTLICGRQHPGFTNTGGDEPILFSGVDVQTIIAMGPQAVKDLSILLTEAVVNFEKEFGVVTTPFTKERSSKNGD